MTSKLSRPDMSLPDDKTCNDCIHMSRCSWLLSRKGTEKVCDWFPIRFVLNTQRGNGN